MALQWMQSLMLHAMATPAEVGTASELVSIVQQGRLQRKAQVWLRTRFPDGTEHLCVSGPIQNESTPCQVDVLSFDDSVTSAHALGTLRAANMPLSYYHAATDVVREHRHGHHHVNSHLDGEVHDVWMWVVDVEPDVN